METVDSFEEISGSLRSRYEQTEQNSHEFRHQNRKKCNEINRLALFVNGAPDQLRTLQRNLISHKCHCTKPFIFLF